MLSKHTKSHPVSIIQTISLPSKEHFSPGRAMWQPAAQSTLQLVAEGRSWLDWNTGSLTIHMIIDINTYANAFGGCGNQTVHFQFCHRTLDFLFLRQGLRYLGVVQAGDAGSSVHHCTALCSLLSFLSKMCSFLRTFTMGINMLPKLITKIVHMGQSSTLLKRWPGTWNGITKCQLLQQPFSGKLFTDPTIHFPLMGLYHLGYTGQPGRADLCSVTCMKSSGLTLKNLHSSWHIPKTLLQQPPCSSHSYKYLINLAPSFPSFNYPYYTTRFCVRRESIKIKWNRYC